MILHASCVAWRGRGALILGPSGSGKSATATALLALGAALVADDRVRVTARDGALWAAAPAAIDGLLEVRGAGLMRVRPHGPARVFLATDLGQGTCDRLPQVVQACINSVCIPLIAGAERPNLYLDVMAALRHGRTPLLMDPEDPTHGDRG